MDESGVKQEIYREAQFGTTVYVMDMTWICYGNEFDMYLIQFKWKRWMRKSRLGVKTENTQSSLFWYNSTRNM